MELIQQVAAQVAIALENALAFKEIDALKDKLAVEKLYLEEEIRSEFSFDEIIGESPALRRTLGASGTCSASRHHRADSR